MFHITPYGTRRALEATTATFWERSQGSKAMDRMLVAVFDSELSALHGFSALRKLEDDGSIGVYISRVVTKHEDGRTTVRNTEDPLPQGTLGGTVLGSLLGILGGPVGIGLGAATGLALGAATDYTRSRVGSDFITDATKALVPGKSALVAEIDEESTDIVRPLMEASGATVFVRDLLEVEDWDYERQTAAIQARLARAEAQLHASRAERRRRLKARVDALNEKLRRTLERAKA
jgi:uncharacterized membrane protein